MRSALVRESRQIVSSNLLASLNSEEDRAAASAHFDQLRSDWITHYQTDRASDLASFPLCKHFPMIRDSVRQEDSFRWIRRMPKGGLLHVHSTAAGRAAFIADYACKHPHCWVLWQMGSDVDHSIQGTMQFSKTRPKEDHYERAIDLARKIDQFPRKLADEFHMDHGDYENARNTKPWQIFIESFSKVNNFISYQPAFQAYFEDTFQTYIDDNIDYVEMRTGVGTLFDLKGNEWASEEQILQYRQALQRFQERHPHFNMRLIINNYRGVQGVHLNRALDFATRMHVKHPEFVIGFDLVGEENMNTPTRSIVGAVVQLQSGNEGGPTIPLYFHDGETTWADNENIIDAYLLNTKRIGHGFNLVAYPEVEQGLRENGVALEVCPISNQMLRYLGDPRLHPAMGYIRRDVPCVLASDDPMIFGNHGLSYDFWMAWMAWDLSLDDMRVLAGNSLLYSGMPPREKAAAIKRWQRKWAEFERSLAAR
ncbi:MAG: hypothetical protein AAFP69_01835 [Planctomycetota bacterium]